MKIGTDGVLLGAWVGCQTAERVLDIGTGTGVIALMIAQRSAAQHIVGIDIDSGAAACAAANFQASPWAPRLEATEGAVQNFAAERFDLIVTNPPYFTDSLLCPDARRSVARHTTELSFEQLDSSVCRLLTEEGRFALILPTEQMEAYLALTALNLVRRCDVSTKPNVPPKRTMVELSPQPCDEVEHTTLTIDTEVHGIYTAEYRELTKDFYLKF